MAKTLEVVGVTETIRALNKLEPGLRKRFTAEAAQIAEPAIAEAKRGYQQVPLSGMARNWQQKGRKIFPYSVPAARRGVRLKVDARREARAVIYVQQANRAAAVFESAGRANNNRLGDSLGDIRPGQTRVIGPAVYRQRHTVARGIERLVSRYATRIQREVR